MKKKGFLIGGAALILAGAMCFAVVLIKHHGDLRRLSAREYTGRVADYENVDCIVVEDENTDIVITSWGHDKVQLEYAECDEEWYDIRWDGATLHVIKRVQPFSTLFSFEFFRPKLYIAVPDDYTGGLDIDTSNGDITAEKPLHGHGAVFATSNGDISLGGGLFDNFSAYNSNGDLTLKAITAPAKFTAVTSNGDVELENIDSADIHVKNSNGDVSGTIMGIEADCDISFRTSNGTGSRGTDNPSAKKKAYIDTSNGDIDVTFTE